MRWAGQQTYSRRLAGHPHIIHTLFGILYIDDRGGFPKISEVWWVFSTWITGSGQITSSKRCAKVKSRNGHPSTPETDQGYIQMTIPSKYILNKSPSIPSCQVPELSNCKLSLQQKCINKHPYINTGAMMLPSQTMHYYKGHPPKLPYICIKFDPPKK